MKGYEQFTVPQWLDYLENRYKKEIQLGLSRAKKVGEQLNLLSPKSPIITITGTNGKGSVVSTLEAIYTAAGYQVASYTSPHLLTFNERIRINQQPISDQALSKAFSVIEEARGATPLTYFEMTTLAALWHFNQYRLDLIILEVGLGGRLDSTNIIDADVSIITTVDLDHQALLGSTREAIGYEKAGILRPNQSFIYADKNPPLSVLERAEALKTVSYYLDTDYQYLINQQTMQFHFKNELISVPRPKLHPNSVAAAIMATLCLKEKLPIGQADLKLGIKNTKLLGRLQVISTSSVTTILDVSHNPQAATYLAEFVKHTKDQIILKQAQENHCDTMTNSLPQVYAIFSALSDKDIPGLIKPLVNEVNYWHFSLLTGKRAASIESINLSFSVFCNQNALCYNTPRLAYHAAYHQAKPGDIILVYGSFLTVSDVMLALDSGVYNEIYN